MQGHHKSFNRQLSGVDNCCNRLGLRFDKPYQTILGQGRGLGAHRVRSNTYRPNCFGLRHLLISPPPETFPAVLAAAIKRRDVAAKISPTLPKIRLPLHSVKEHQQM